MNKLWSDRAWDDYLYWQTQDKKTLKKINELVKDIERNGLSEGIGNTRIVSPKKTKKRIVDKIIELRNIPALTNSNFTHFYEIIRSLHGITLCYSTVSKILIEHGFISPKKRRRKKAVRNATA